MNAYIYQAALLCEDCTTSARMKLAPKTDFAHDTKDSDRWPQGPYPDGGGEADCPQHCDHCNVFLENPLTCAGYDYLQECISGEVLMCDRRERIDQPHADVSEVLKTWLDFYGENNMIEAMEVTQ